MGGLTRADRHAERERASKANKRTRPIASEFLLVSKSLVFKRDPTCEQVISSEIKQALTVPSDTLKEKPQKLAIFRLAAVR